MHRPLLRHRCSPPVARIPLLPYSCGTPPDGAEPPIDTARPFGASPRCPERRHGGSGGRWGAEGPAVGCRAGVQGLLELQPHRGWRAESGAGRDVVDGLVGGLQEPPRRYGGATIWRTKRKAARARIVGARAAARMPHRLNVVVCATRRRARKDCCHQLPGPQPMPGPGRPSTTPTVPLDTRGRYPARRSR